MTNSILKQTLKKNSFYVGAAVILVACLGVLKLMEHQKEEVFFEKREEKVFPNLNIDAVAEVELELPGMRLILVKQDDEWSVQPNLHPANQVYVKSLLREIRSLTYGDLISTRVEDHPKYNLDAQSRLVILRSFSKAELARVYVGDPGANYRTIFYRLANDERVFRTVSDLYPSLSRATWYSRSIWMVPPSAMPEIRFEWMDQADILKLQDGAWQSEASQVPDTEKINKILSLTAQNAEDLASSYANRTPDGQLQIQTGPVTMSLALFKGEKGILAMRSDQPKSLVYSLPANLLPPYMDDTNNQNDNLEGQQ